MSQAQTKQPTFLQALTPLVALVLMLTSSVLLFGEDSSYGPNQIALLTAAAIATAIAFYNGFSWSNVEQGITQGISVALGAILIILMVGALIGSWLLAGIVPTMIYYGLELLNPSWFYAAACLISAIVALSIGSSWTTAATIGVALIGVATGMEMSVVITAAAVVSGAYFGDKMSPLSDTTNLAPAVSGTEIFAHIRYMTWVSVPAFVLALVLYLFLGFTERAGGNMQSLQLMQDQLQANFNIGWWMLLPLAMLFFLAARKYPALPSIFVGALIGAVWALLFQGEVVAEYASTLHQQGGLRSLTDDSSMSLLAPLVDLLSGSFGAVWYALANGFAINTGNADLDNLLSGGGMVSMLNTVWLIVAAMTFGAVMESTGLLQKILSGLMQAIHSSGSLIAATLFTCFGVNVLTADQYMAIVLPGRMYREAYQREGLDPRVLSRTLESGGTVTSAMIPWNTCGAYMFAVLGVYPLHYAPFAFFLYLVPLIALIYGYTNFKILRIEPNKEATAKL